MSPSVGPVRRSGSTARRNASREDEERLTDGGVRSDNGPEFMAKITAVGAKGDDVRLCGMPGIHNDFAT